MTKKNLNVVELILQSLAALLLFFPRMYCSEIWRIIPPPSVRTYQEYNSFFDVANSSYNGNILPQILGYFMVGLMLVNIAILILTIFESSKISKVGNKAHVIIPILIVAFFIIFTVAQDVIESNLGQSELKYTFVFSPETLFYIEMFFLLCVVLVASMKCSKKIEEQPIRVKAVSCNEESRADELKKYKDLLDSGVITQEEFDTKKKQLLGL